MKPHDKKAALAELSRLYPDARPALHYKSAYELLVAVILSAQCTDERVNKVTEKLFEEHSTPETMCALKQEQLEKYLNNPAHERFCKEIWDKYVVNQLDLNILSLF